MTPAEREDLILTARPFITRYLAAYARKLPESERDDAISDGIVGLIQAADSYDPQRGMSFASYACRRALGAAIDGLRRRDHLPRHERRRVTARGDAPIATSDMAPLSLGQPTTKGMIVDTLADPAPGPARQAQARLLHDALYAAIHDLPERERLVMLLQLQDVPLRVVGQILGVTESRCSQLRSRAMERMRPRLRDAA